MISPETLSTCHWENLVKEHEGKNLFYISQNGSTISLSYIRRYNYPIHDVVHLWRIENTQDGILRRQKKKFYLHLTECNKDHFIFYISKHYAEYMEWFLFNPEWLQ